MSIFGNLFGQNSSDADLQAFVDMPNFNSLTGGDDQNALSMATAFVEVSSARKSTDAALSELEGYWLLTAVINLLQDELLTQVNRDQIVTMKSSKSSVNKVLKAIHAENDLDQMVTDMLPDLLRKGEYFLRMGTRKNDDGNKVHFLADDVKASEMLAVYRSGLVDSFVVIKADEDNYSTTAKTRDPSDYVHFSLGNHRKRINLDNKKNKHDLPTQVRVGTTLFFGLLSKLKELYLMEKLVPASELSNLQSGNIVGVSIPATTKPEAAHKIVTRYERMLNSTKTAVDRATNQITVSKILSIAGRTRVLPMFGDKGSLDKVDVSTTQDTGQLAESIADGRRVTLSAIGIPPGLLLVDELDTGTVQLKRHTRYVRLLVSIQNSMISGLYQVAYAYLAKEGVTYDPKDIEITVGKKFTDLSNLDHIELASAQTTVLSDILSFLNDVREVAPDALPEDVYEDYIHDQLQKVLDLKYKKGSSEEPQAPDVGSGNGSAPVPPEEPKNAELSEILSQLDSLQ